MHGIANLLMRSGYKMKDMIKCIRNIIFSLVFSIPIPIFKSLISSFLIPIWVHSVNDKSYTKENFLIFY